MLGNSAILSLIHRNLYFHLQTRIAKNLSAKGMMVKHFHKKGSTVTNVKLREVFSMHGVKPEWL